MNMIIVCDIYLDGSQSKRGVVIMDKKKNKYEKMKRKSIRKLEEARREFNQLLVIYSIFGLVIIGGLIVLFAKPETKANEIAFSVEDITFEDQSFWGDPDAPVTLVEFVDFKCPHCKTFTEQIIGTLEPEYVDTGKVKIVIVNYPFLGLDSMTAALAAETMFKMAPEAFRDFVKAIFGVQQAMSYTWATPELMADLAVLVAPEIDREEFLRHIRNRTYDDEVKKDLALVQSLGVTGTPTVYINGNLVLDRSYPSIVNIIEAELQALEQEGDETA